MQWAGLLQVGWVRNKVLLSRILDLRSSEELVARARCCFCSSLEPGFGRSSESLRLGLRPESCVSWLERAFLRSSERGVCFRVLRSSEHFVARASFWVADLKHRVFGSSELFFARAWFFCVWSLERPSLRSSEPVQFK